MTFKDDSYYLTPPLATNQSATLARIGALATEFTFRRRVTPQDLLGLGEEAAADVLVQAVHDAHQCPLSLLLLDDLEVKRVCGDEGWFMRG